MPSSPDALGRGPVVSGSVAQVGAWLGDQGLAVAAVDASGAVTWANDCMRSLLADEGGAHAVDPTDVHAEAVGRAAIFGAGLVDGLSVGEVRAGTVTVAADRALLEVRATAFGVEGDDGGTIGLVSFPAFWHEGVDPVHARRLEVMLSRTSDIITVIDRQGTVLYSNEAAGRITGIRGTDANGTSVFGFIHPDDHQLAKDAFARGVLAGEPIEPIEVRMRHADGSWHHVEARIDDHVEDEAVGGYVLTIRDISDRVRRQQEQAVTDRRLESIVENIDDVIVILDRQMSVLWVSPGIERLVDAPAYTNIGESAFNDMHPDDVAGVVEALQTVMAEPEGRGRCELRLQHRRLGWRWVEAALVNRLEDPAVGGVVCTLRDVTDQRTTNVELRRLSDRARQSADHLREMDRLKDEFLATVSHELRTPLTAVRGFSELLARRSDRLDLATREQLATRIHDNARQMNDMVEQLLDFSRLKAGRVELDLGALDVAELVDLVLERLEPQLSDRVLDVAVDGFRVIGDRNAFGHVMRNLLTNAAGYSEPGSVIEVWGERHDGEIWISVRDHGIGIRADEHALVFQSFYQSDPGATGRRGTGVGLNIARRYAQLQHGRLRMGSAPGEGSTFTLVLPEAT